MYGGLIAINKHPDISPVIVVETWKRHFSKCVLKVRVPEATIVYQYDQICDRLKAVIDGTVHGVQAIWDTKLATEDWGFLLADAKNAFDEIN